jgi:hypothetical protein
MSIVDPVVRSEQGPKRASICSSMSGAIGGDAVDPAEHVRTGMGDGRRGAP